MSLDIHLTAMSSVEVFSANITHNLGEMADLAGLYQVLWRPQEIEITTALQAIPRLQEGLKKLKEDPARFRLLNPPNGWGSYDVLVEFVERLIDACELNPDAEITVSR